MNKYLMELYRFVLTKRFIISLVDEYHGGPYHGQYQNYMDWLIEKMRNE